MPSRQPSNLPGSTVATLLASVDELRTVLAELAGRAHVAADQATAAVEDEAGPMASERPPAESPAASAEDEQPSTGARAAAGPAFGPDPAVDGLGADEHLALLRELVQHAAEIRSSLRRIEGRGQPALFTEPPLAD